MKFATGAHPLHLHRMKQWTSFLGKNWRNPLVHQCFPHAAVAINFHEIYIFFVQETRPFRTCWKISTYHGALLDPTNYKYAPQMLRRSHRITTGQFLAFEKLEVKAFKWRNYK